MRSPQLPHCRTIDNYIQILHCNIQHLLRCSVQNAFKFEIYFLNCAGLVGSKQERWRERREVDFPLRRLATRQRTVGKSCPRRLGELQRSLERENCVLSHQTQVHAVSSRMSRSRAGASSHVPSLTYSQSLQLVMYAFAHTRSLC